VRLTTLAVAVTLLASAPLPAAAETWHGRDARHDVRGLTVTFAVDDCDFGPLHAEPDDEQRDVRRIAVDHGPEDVVVELRMGALAARRDDTYYEVGLRTRAGRFLVEGYGRHIDLHEVRPLVDPDAGDACGPVGEVEERSCPGLTTAREPRTHSLTFTVPRGCLDDPAWVRVGARVSYSELHDESVTVRYDAWTADGRGKAFGTLPPLGPKVLRG
jgi:hypothetical protein